MKRLWLTFIAITAILHVYIAWFEIFAWTTRGPVVFDTFPADMFEPTIQLAANQGIYNAFLAVGLIWSLFIQDRIWQRRIASCFLGFVIVAGIAAAITISFRAGIFQIVPSGLAMIIIALDTLAMRKSN